MGSNYADLVKTGLTPGLVSGCTTVITGGGRGIGREICLLFAHLGARIVVDDRKN